MSDFDLLYKNLEDYMKLVDKRFMETIHQAYKNDQTIDLTAYDFDIRTYCILIHAGVEEYVENLVGLIAKNLLDMWTNQKKIHKVTILLIIENLTEGLKRNHTLTDNHLTGLITKAKKQFDYRISKNHGLNKEKLYELFAPVGIEIDSYVNELNSLGLLANTRNEFAHKSTCSITLYSPTDYKSWVDDCLKLCDGIRIQAKTIT